MRSPELTIVIPAKDEEKRIARPLYDLCEYFSPKNASRNPDRPLTEIIVVINNTTDDTEKVVAKYARKYNRKYSHFIRYVNIPGWTGKGGAISAGFKMARGKYIAILDADGSSAPMQVMKLYKRITESGADATIANRYRKDSYISGNMPVHRTIFSRLFNLLVVTVLFQMGYKDTQCGLKIFKGKAAKEFADRMTCDHWIFDLNLLLMAKYTGLRVVESETKWTYKPDSKLDIAKSFPKVVKEVLQLKNMEIRTLLKIAGDKFLVKSKVSNHLLSKRSYRWSDWIL